MKIQKSVRVVKVFINDKHRKSFPLFMEDLIPLIPTAEIKLMSKGKTLSSDDCERCSVFVFGLLVARFYTELKEQEKYIFELTEDNPVQGVRKVNAIKNEERFELVLKNNFVKIRCPEHLYKFCSKKLPTVSLNY